MWYQNGQASVPLRGEISLGRIIWFLLMFCLPSPYGVKFPDTLFDAVGTGFVFRPLTG